MPPEEEEKALAESPSSTDPGPADRSAVAVEEDPTAGLTDAQMATLAPEVMADSLGEYFAAWGRRLRNGESGALPIIVGLIFIVIFVTTVEIPAAFMLIYWFAIQLLSGLGSMSSVSQAQGIAWFAHVGGFIAGILLVRVFGQNRARYLY